MSSTAPHEAAYDELTKQGTRTTENKAHPEAAKQMPRQPQIRSGRRYWGTKAGARKQGYDTIYGYGHLA